MSIPAGYDGPINPNPTGSESTITAFGYVPNRALACIGVLVFLLALIAHIALCVKIKSTRAFQALFAFGCLLETVGYCVRVVGHYRPFDVSYYVAQFTLIVIAPSAFSAGLFLSLSIAIRRLSWGMGHGLLSFSPRILVYVFGAIDLVTTVIQITGASLVGVSESRRLRSGGQQGVGSISTSQANDILVAGLAIQTASFLAFLIILILVTYRSNMTRPAVLKRKLTGLMIATSFLVFLRTTFRLAETSQGVFGPAATNEVLFATLEFVPIGMAVSLWAYFSLDSMLPPELEHDQVEKWEGRTYSFSGSTVGRL
ncbi:hypothetical protein OIO90_003439 [Microbotryomycetes sp. JL221]|nr:hypothetical protein OIO90_003439 [Microbotryomycetes sp. JL221]